MKAGTCVRYTSENLHMLYFFVKDNGDRMVFCKMFVSNPTFTDLWTITKKWFNEMVVEGKMEVYEDGFPYEVVEESRIFNELKQSEL